MKKIFQTWRILSAAALIGAASVAQADGLKSLEQFIKGSKSGSMTFEQTVSSPKGNKKKNSSGQFLYQRPSQFKFVYEKPFEQVLLADGEWFWMYDVELAQATRRKQSAVLGGTPAALIAQTNSLSDLQKSFNVAAQPDAEGLQWAKVTPKKSGGFKELRIGLSGEGSSVKLAQLQILDNFNQRSVLKFSGYSESVPAGSFTFKPPADVKVMKN